MYNGTARSHTDDPVLKMLSYLRSLPCFWWISTSLDIVLGVDGDTADLPEWYKMFQAIFYNPTDWKQLPCNKLMDTVKIFGHFTVAINGAFRTTLGVTDVGLALLKIRFTLLKFVCQHTQHIALETVREN